MFRHGTETLNYTGTKIRSGFDTFCIENVVWLVFYERARKSVQ